MRVVPQRADNSDGGKFMATVTVRFGSPQDNLPTTFDGKEVRFPYKIVENQYIDTPRQSSKTKHGHFIVRASGSLIDPWGLQGSELTKALFQAVKEHISEKLQNISEIEGDIEIRLNSSPHSGQCPYDIDHIEEPNGAIVQIEINR